MFKEEKELWVKFACGALAGMEDIAYGNHDTVVRDCEAVADYADEMVRRYYEKFENC